MARSLSFLLFFVIALSLIFGMHYYLWLRLVRDPEFSPTTKRLLTSLIVVLGCSIPVAMVTGRLVKPEIAGWWLKPAYVWLGASFLLLVSVLIFDLIRLGYHGIASLSGTPIDLARRQTLARLVGVAAAALGLGATATAFREAARIQVKRVDIPLKNLPLALEGTTIVQLTDVHVGPTIGRTFIEQVVNQVNALKPDIVAITGDLVDGSVADLAHHVAPLGDIKSQYGTFFVTGNHEYYSGAPAWCQHLSELGIRVLRNEHVKIGPLGQHLHLAGVDDLHASRFEDIGHGPNLPQAVEGRDPELPLILLAHQPKVVTEAVKHGVDLQLSGHTHGGQLWPFSWLVKLQQPVVAGLEHFGQTLVYVSCGTGYWGPPMRLKAPPEVTHIVLRRA
jgi:uncharacterized protein